jgi:hypothetical protein
MIYAVVVLNRRRRMSDNSGELTKLREYLRSAIVEVEMAIDTATYPDWSETKEGLLKALEVVRKLERDQAWSRLAKK